MGTLDQARGHVRKAKEFLDAGELALDHDMFDVATSNAVLSGINAKDAICLKLTGKSDKTQDHNDASAELKKAGPKAATVAGDLTRLVSSKAKAQYQSTAMARSEAVRAIERAQRLYDVAVEVVTTK